LRERRDFGYNVTDLCIAERRRIMATSSVPFLDWQVNRVRRRMFFQHLVNASIVAWVVACAAFAGWWLARPHVLGATLQPWMDWTAGVGIFAVATIVAVVLSIRRTPNAIFAALSLDDRFQLRERVTTSMLLTPAMQATPAGQALLADVESRITSLDVGSRFPVRFGWKSALVPAAVVALALLAIFYDPAIGAAQGGDTATATPLAPEVAKELEQKKQEFLQKPKADPKEEQRAKSIDAQKIEAKLQDILKRPMTTTDEVKDRLAEISKLEEEVKKKEKEEADKVDALKDQLSKLDKLSKKQKAKAENEKKNEGDKNEDKKEDEKKPGEELADALKQGETKKAKQEAERLSKKLKNNEMKKEEKDHLKEEAKQLKDELKERGEERKKELEEKQKENEQRRQEKEKQLEQQRAENKIDEKEHEQKKKELEEERKQEQQQNEQEQKDLGDLKQKMEKCEQCLKDGDQEGASQAMREAGEKLDEMEKREQNLEDIQGELQRMQDLRESMAKACDKPGQGRDDKEGDANTLNRDKDEGEDKKQDGKPTGGGKKGGVGKGKRPDGKPIDTKSVDGKQRAAWDDKGQKIDVGTAGQADKVIGKSSVSLQGEIKQASQSAPQSVDTQRIPRGYKDVTKGYFKKIGDQKTSDSVPKK